MYIRLLLICWFCIGAIHLTFGQERKNIEKALYSERHYVFYNISNYFDLNGNSLQFGYNYQCLPFMDLQLEAGFLSDDLLGGHPFTEYAGFRFRPQIKFLRRKSLNKRKRWYAGIILSYQQMTFKENQSFRIDDSFNQNITYRGNDRSIAWYLATGMDTRLSNQLFFSFSIGLGEVLIKTNPKEGEIPENARLIDDCNWFCGRSESLNSEIKRPGFLLDIKFGYRF